MITFDFYWYNNIQLRVIVYVWTSRQQLSIHTFRKYWTHIPTIYNFSIQDLKRKEDLVNLPGPAYQLCCQKQ